MKLVFFRHGPAVPPGTPGVAEAERPLTPEGRKKTLQAARGLKRLDLGIDAVFASPLPRALQTAEIVAEVLRLRPKLMDALAPGTPAGRLLEEVAKLDAKVPVLVGHEPMLSAAMSLAICGSTKGSFELKKAGLAMVEFGEGENPHRGSLRLLLAPSILRTLGR